MVRNLLSLLHREIRGLHAAAYFLGIFALLSAVLALVRDRLLAHYFGAGDVLDIYYAAFRLPDMVFVSVASLVSIYALIPFLSRNEDGEEGQRRFIGHILSAFLFFISGVSLVLFFLAPYILPRLFPGLVDSVHFDTLIILTRLLLLQPIVLGISNIFGSVTQVYGRFVLYGITPLLYNLGIIIGVLFFYPSLGLLGLGYGVLLGAVLHAGIQLPFVAARGFLSRITVRFNMRELKDVVTLSLPRTLALSAQHIALLFLISIASLMAKGSITVFSLSFNLQAVPLAIIGVSYSVAAFPTLARLFSSGNKEEYIEHILTAARHIIFWSTPIVVLVVVLRAQIVRVILGSGAFDWTDTRLTAALFALFSLSLVAQGLTLLFVRGYYASGRTQLPFVVNVFSGALTIASAGAFLYIFNASDTWRFFFESLFRIEGIPGTEVLMLPLGFSFGAIVNAGIFWFLFGRDARGFSRRILKVFFEVLSASVVMGFITHQLLNLFDDIFDIETFWGIFAQGFFSGIIGILAGSILLIALGNKEIGEIKQSLLHRFWKTPVVGGERTEL
ncbi:MAG: oligosaccharide flippase family protein [Candidatus Pacebacteria bacterium]|nr:oligosaccharide flippase family protein [Candidatus Paceibacterota bacterium]